MAYRFEYDTEHGVLAARMWGPISDAELAALNAEWPLHVEPYGPRFALLDLTDVSDVNVSPRFLQEISTLPPNFDQTMPRVIVAPTDLLFGFARMFQATFSAGERLEVVRTYDAALEFLGVSRDAVRFVPIPKPETRE